MAKQTFREYLDSNYHFYEGCLPAIKMVTIADAFVAWADLKEKEPGRSIGFMPGTTDKQRIDLLMKEVRRVSNSSLLEATLKKYCRISDHGFLDNGTRSDEWEHTDPVRRRDEMAGRLISVLDHYEAFQAQHDAEFEELQIEKSKVRALEAEREGLRSQIREHRRYVASLAEVIACLAVR